MTKKLFCHLSLRYLPLQYFGDGYYKIGKNDKKQRVIYLELQYYFKIHFLMTFLTFSY